MQDKDTIYSSSTYCLNINYRIKDSANQTFNQLHSGNKDADMIEVPITSSTPMFDSANRNPFKQPLPIADPVMTTMNKPCLIPFNIWQETNVGILPEEINSITEDIQKAGEDIKNAVFDTSSKKECELSDGIFIKNTCHYYQVLKNLCIKINFEKDDYDLVKDISFVEGCYADGESMQFKNAKVGSYYDFEESVSMEIRAAQDPYMVFAYTRDNLGTDFTIFLYLSIISFIGAVIA